MREEVRRAYRLAFEEAGDTAMALLAAAVRFNETVGRGPTRAELEAMLRGVMLGDDHPLMQLLQAPAPARRRDDLKPSEPSC